jgi:DNA-binding SARP family transcriptional activator
VDVKNIEITLLGQPQVRKGGDSVRLVRRKSRAVLYYISARNQSVPRSQLLALFWPDLPRPAAQQTLRTTLHGLRQALGDGLVIKGEVIGLASSVLVDVHTFESVLGKQPEDLTELQTALDLYRGDFMEGFQLEDSQAFEDWVNLERERYRRMAIRGLAALAAVSEARQEYETALSYLERALAFNPLQEDLQRDCMRLLYLAGDRPGAIRRYDELRKLLDKEMGVPPMAETRSLYDAIVTDRFTALARPTPMPQPRAPEPPLKSADELPFVGRSRELKTLTDLVRTNRLVLIEGEPGIGKTRLAEEFIHSSKALPLIGRARELERALPHQPWIDALRGLLRQPEWLELASTLHIDLAPVWFSEVGRLLPELVGSAQKEVTKTRSADEARLWESVRQFLAVLSTRWPLIIFLDDLQWADAATLGLLSYLVRHLAGPSISFLSAANQFYPNSPAVKNSALVAFVQSNVRENRLARLPLNRLSPQAVQSIAQYLSPVNAEPLANWLLRGSEGNPYFLAELVRAAREKGMFDAQGRLNIGMLSTTLLPQTVYSLIQPRLAKLSERARRVLDTAVVAGREFEVEVVCLASGLSESAALDALEELRSLGLIIPEGNTRFTFDHSLTMEVAYREVGELRHRLLHRRIAEAIENVYRNRLDDVAGQLVRHFVDGGASQRAAPYAFLAGQQAARLAAWNEAVAFYDIALSGIGNTEDQISIPRHGHSHRLSILTAQGEAHRNAGHYAQASEVLHQAVELAARQPQGEINEEGHVWLDDVYLALALTLLPLARFDEAIAVAQKLRASGRPESILMGELTWGTALSIEGRDLQEARQHLQQAEEMWQKCGKTDLAILAQVKFELGSVAAQQGALDQAIAYYRESLQAALQTSSEPGLERTILAYNNLAYHLSLLGDPQAEGYARQGLALAQEKGVLGYQPFLYSTLGEIALAGGVTDKAEQLFFTGLELAERLSIAERVAGLTANLGLVAMRRGQNELAIQRLSQALEQADKLGTHHLSTQIRIWLAPLLPPEVARQRLAEARLTAETSGRQRLLDEITRLDEDLKAAASG